MVGIQKFQSLNEIAFAFNAFTISHKLNQFRALKGYVNVAFRRELYIYSAAVILEFIFKGDIQKYTSELKKPVYEQSYTNLLSLETVNTL